MQRHLKTAGIATVAAAFILAAGCTKKTEQATTTNADGSTSSAPSGQQAAKAKMALVRFVNALPGESRDLYFGDLKTFPGVSFKSVTPYKQLPSERQDFRVVPAGSTAANAGEIRNSEGLTDGAHYTVVAAVGKDGKPQLNVINDNLSEPSSGKAKIRVINASPIEVNVAAPALAANSATGTADRAKTPADAARVDNWFDGVNQDSSTRYKEVDPMNGTLRVLPSGHVKGRTEVAPEAALVPVDLSPGKIYTLIVTSDSKRGGVDVIKVEDELVTAAAYNPSKL